MTTDTQLAPTDDEILDEARAAGIDWHKHWNDDDTNRLEIFARAVLARWGQPARSGEPVARLEIGKTKGGVSLTHTAEPAAFQLPEGMYALYTTPQPTQAQAWAVPLTPEQRTAAFIRAEKKMQSDVNLTWRHALADEIEAAHGIKGGQHDF